MLVRVGWGGSIGIIWVSLFEAYDSVVARGLCQADGKMNEEVGIKNCLIMSGRKKRLVRFFRRQEL